MQNTKELPIITVQGTEALISPPRLDQLRAGLRGALLCRGDPGYDEARRIHNGMIDRQPALIVRCAGVAGVITSVRLAAEHDLRVAVRGGGHGVPGFAVCDGGLDDRPVSDERHSRRSNRAHGPR